MLFLESAGVVALPSAEGASSPLGVLGKGHGGSTAPYGMREECSAGGLSGFQQCRSLNDPPRFHIRAKVRSLRLHIV